MSPSKKAPKQPPEALAKPPEPFVPRPRRQLHAPHRGGAWKVAYADFVTALMALFIVLWMMNSTQAVKSSVTGYFHDPRGYTSKLGAGPANAGEGLPIAAHNAESVRQQLEQALRRMPDFRSIRDHVQFSVTGEGLRIDLTETEQGMFFVTGSPEPTPAGEHLLVVLGAELGRMPNPLVIEGHTDSRPFRNAMPSKGYGNWELSAERANAARRLLHSYGIRPEQVSEVRGYADQKPILPDSPEHARNRRVSVVVRFEVPKV
jgi:chemotaxis protein MotB